MSSVTATSSSVHDTHGPEKAIDGNERTDFDDCNCCFASNGHEAPWLHLDLNARYTVARIVIWGRTDSKHIVNYMFLLFIKYRHSIL